MKGGRLHRPEPSQIHLAMAATAVAPPIPAPNPIRVEAKHARVGQAGLWLRRCSGPVLLLLDRHL
jgi:hypothetical protein